MKKLAMKAQKLGATEVLSRDQLKRVHGGGPCGADEVLCRCGTGSYCAPLGSFPQCEPCCGGQWC